MDWIEKVGIVSSVALPLFNIPLILHIVRRRSSDDISMTWAVGVWVCIVLMTPQALRSSDPAFRVYGAFNVLFFSVVLFFILKYRTKVYERGEK